MSDEAKKVTGDAKDMVPPAKIHGEEPEFVTALNKHVAEANPGKNLEGGERIFATYAFVRSDEGRKFLDDFLKKQQAAHGEKPLTIEEFAAHHSGTNLNHPAVTAFNQATLLTIAEGEGGKFDEIFKQRLAVLGVKGEDAAPFVKTAKETLGIEGLDRISTLAKTVSAKAPAPQTPAEAPAAPAVAAKKASSLSGLEAEIAKRFDGYADKKAQLEEAARRAGPYGFAESLEGNDRLIYEAKSPHIELEDKRRNLKPDETLKSSQELKQERLTKLKDLGMSDEAIDAQYQKLNDKDLCRAVAHADLKSDFDKRVLDAKRAIFKTEDGKALIMQHYDTELKTKAGLFRDFLDEVSTSETPAHIGKESAHGPAAFARALENGELSSSRHMSILIGQARELADIQETPNISDIFGERLEKVGLTKEQAKVYVDTVKAYENGTLEAHLAQLEKIATGAAEPAPAAPAEGTTREAPKPAAAEAAPKPAAEAPAPAELPKEPKAPGAGAAAANEEKTLWNSIKKGVEGHKGLAIAGAVVALGAIAYGAVRMFSKKPDQDQSWVERTRSDGQQQGAARGA